MIDLLKLARIAAAPFGGDEDMVGDIALGLVECSPNIDVSFQEAQVARWLLTRARWLALAHLRKLRKELPSLSQSAPDAPSADNPLALLHLKRVLLEQDRRDIEAANLEGPRGSAARHRLRAALRKEGFLS